MERNPSRRSENHSNGTPSRRPAQIALVLPIVALSTMALVGCAMQVETPREPPPANYRQIVADHIRQTFLDPYSMRDAAIAPPRPGWGYAGSMGQYETGWAVCVRANSKNRMGAYTGSKEMIFIVRGGQVVGSGQNLESSEARKGCEGVHYEPFTEIEEPGRVVKH